LALSSIHLYFSGTSSTGGGAGGRVAVYYTSSEYTGEFTAYGGQSSGDYGGAGTVYVDTGSKTKIIVDNKEAHTVQVNHCSVTMEM
jgi:hypothetical protein